MQVKNKILYNAKMLKKKQIYFIGTHTCTNVCQTVLLNFFCFLGNIKFGY